MISAPSSRRYFFECLKRYAGVIVISLYLHVMYIIDFAMAQQGVYLFSGDSRLGPQNSMIFNITIILAVLNGLQGFAYLHSEKRTLFYLGLPLKRSSLFIYNYICGFLAAVIPNIVSRIICVFMMKEGQEDALYFFQTGILVSALGFLLMYHLVILVLVLTGRLWAALLGAGAVLVYGTYFVGSVIEKYSNAFFATYYKIDTINDLVVYLSPKILYTNLAGIEDFTIGDSWSVQGRTGYLTVMVIAVILTGMASLFLFRLRQAESAGKTLAFKKSRGVIKIMLLIPLTLISGYYAMCIPVSGKSIPFLFGGILIGGFLLGGLMEMLEKADVRAFVSNKLSTLGIAAVSILLAGSFVFNIWSYDSYLPDSDEIESVAVSIGGLENTDMQLEYADTQLNVMALSESDKVNVLSWVSNLSKTDGTSLTYAAVAYKYSDSKVIYRRYAVTGVEQIEQFSPIYESADYKKATIPLAAEQETGRWSFLWSNGVETYHLAFSDAENQELLDCYQNDLENFNMKQLIEDGNPIGLLKLTPWDEESGRTGYIYPSFQKTIHYLEAKGVHAGSSIEDYNILRIEIRDQEGKTNNYETGTEINELKSQLICEELLVNPVLTSDTSDTVTVKCLGEDGRTYTISECKRIE
ncbi:MAG: DUF6449 domain-containing protein [Lachnospiraceae bacterium]